MGITSFSAEDHIMEKKRAATTLTVARITAP